jgi:hypothetical protein
VPGTDRGYLRNLDNHLNFNDIAKASSIQDAGVVWGGGFWEMRNSIGKQVVDKLLFTTWKAMIQKDFSQDIVRNFVQRLLNTDNSIYSGEHSNKIKSVFENRGAKL